MHNNQKINKIELLLYFMAKSVLFVALADLIVNLSPITYVLFILIGVFVYRYRFFKLLKKGMIKQVKRSMVFSFLYPLLIITAFSFKIHTLTQYQKNRFLIDNQWKIDKVTHANNSAYFNSNQICDTVKFYKYGIRLSSKIGVISIKYRFSVKGRLKILASQLNAINGEECSGKFLISEIDSHRGFSIKRVMDKLILTNSDDEIVLKVIKESTTPNSVYNQLLGWWVANQNHSTKQNHPSLNTQGHRNWIR